MTHTYGLKTAKDLLDKLERDADHLRDEVSSDMFFNFIITAYSLVDWVSNDPSVSSQAKTDISRFRTVREMQICRDIANASKHFSLDPARNRNPIVSSVDSEEGYDAGRYDVGGYDEDEEQIAVTLNDGTTINVLNLIDDILREWNLFFSSHGL